MKQLSRPAPMRERTLDAATGDGARAFDVQRIRRDFPILGQKTLTLPSPVRLSSPKSGVPGEGLGSGKPLIYLDNAATTQKPQSVIDATRRYYESENANIHRGVYQLSQVATSLYEEARVKVQRFLNARESREIIFTRGATESINLVASSFGRKFLTPGDEIIVSGMEHHSNIVPWQIIAEQAGAVLRVVPINDRGELIFEEYEKLLNPRTKLVAMVHVSNSLGTINPIRQVIELAHQRDIPVLVDGAQWVAHGQTDVQALDCDFYAFSGHKLLGPTGIGVLYGKAALLDSLPPYQGGGDMIESVTFKKTIYAQLPNKFEAGTPNIAGAIGLAAAIDYIQSIGFDAIAAYERELLEYATRRLSEIPGLRIVGTAKDKASVISFVVDDPPISALDLGTKLDGDGIAVRTGHHCCQPVMDRFHIPGTTRASLAFYNTREEIDALVQSVRRIVQAAKEKTVAKKAASAPHAGRPNGAPGQAVGGPAMVWPEAVADSPQAAADELAEVFEMFEDRDMKNQQVLEMGEKLPHAFDLLKKITEQVPGCMSEVYVIGRKTPGTEDRLQFMADANADIVRGLIAMLERVYSGQRAQDILSFDVEAFFRRIGLEQFISSQRRNGLQGMVRRIKALANGLAA